jgi:hypothetical protein
MDMPLSASEIVYEVALESSIDPYPITLQTDKENPIIKTVWATLSSCSHDCLDETLQLDEAIIEAMNGSDKPWDDVHHHSYFIPELARIEQDDFRSTLSDMVGHIVDPLDMHNIYAE